MRSILGINLHDVRRDRITNAYVRSKFYNFPDARRIIAARTLNFVGKLGRELHNGVESMPAQLLSSWVNNKRRPGGQCTTVKRTITKHLRLLYGENISDIVGNTTITFMDNCGSFKYWLKDACNKPYWKKLIEAKLMHPEREIPLPSRASTPSSSQPSTPPSTKKSTKEPTKKQIGWHTTTPTIPPQT